MRSRSSEPGGCFPSRWLVVAFCLTLPAAAHAAAPDVPDVPDVPDAPACASTASCETELPARRVAESLAPWRSEDLHPEEPAPDEREADPADGAGQADRADAMGEAEAPLRTTTTVGARSKRPAIEEPRSVTLLDGEALERGAGERMVDTLDQAPGVHAQATNRGAGAPIVRGQVGPGVLLLWDGVRINNPTFRTGPNQYLNLFDPLAIEQVELLRGTGGVLYGSDAIGGAVAMRSRGPRFGRGWEGRLVQRFASADTSYLVSPEIGWGGRELAFLAGGTVARYGTLRTGGGAEVPGSDYERYTARAAVAWLPDVRTELGLQYQGAWIRDAARIERIHDNNARLYDNDLHLLALHAEHLGEGAFEQVDASLSWVRTREEVLRYNCRRTDVYGLQPTILTSADPLGCLAGDPEAVSVRLRNVDRVDTVGSALSVTSALPVEGLSVVWGGDAYQSFVESSEARAASEGAEGFAQEEPAARGAFSAGSRSGALGAFAMGRWARRLGPTLVLEPQAGVRVDHVRASAPEVPGLGDVDYDWTGATGSALVSLRVRERATLFAGWSQGFRAPNLQETTLLGDTGNTFEIPNADLRPERANGFEVGTRMELVPLSLDLSLWTLHIGDVIDREPATFEGEDQVGGTDVVRRVNAGSARWYGAEGGMVTAPVLRTQLEAGGGWIRGDVESAAGVRNPARREPPLRWRLALRHELPMWNAFAELTLRGAAAQTRLNPGDERDLRICGSRTYPGVLLGELGADCEGSPAWTTLSLRFRADIAEHTRLGLRFDNLLDRRYRHHGSGYDEAGFNAMITLENRFGAPR